MAVAHAVIASEVGRSLRRRHDVVGGQRIFGVRQRNLDDLRALRLQPVRAHLPERIDLWRRAVDAILLRDADPQALHTVFQTGLIVRHGDIDAGGIFGVHARHVAQQDRGIAHGARHRARLIERRGECDGAPARTTAISRFQANRACDGGGLAD